MSTTRRGFLGFLGLGAVASQVPLSKWLEWRGTEPIRDAARAIPLSPPTARALPDSFSREQYLYTVAQMVLENWKPVTPKRRPDPKVLTQLHVDVLPGHELAAARELVKAIHGRGWNYMQKLPVPRAGARATLVHSKSKRICLRLVEQYMIEYDDTWARLDVRGAKL